MQLKFPMGNKLTLINSLRLVTAPPHVIRGRNNRHRAFQWQVIGDGRKPVMNAILETASSYNSQRTHYSIQYRPAYSAFNLLYWLNT